MTYPEDSCFLSATTMCNTIQETHFTGRSHLEFSYAHIHAVHAAHLKDLLAVYLKIDG